MVTQSVVLVLTSCSMIRIVSEVIEKDPVSDTADAAESEEERGRETRESVAIALEWFIGAGETATRNPL